MSAEIEEKHQVDDLTRAQELFDFLQGKVPKGYKIPRKNRPKLTADQAWTVMWYLGNQYWQVPDHIERCDVCGDIYDSHAEGDCLDFGKAPYHFCESCQSSWVYEEKQQSKANPENKSRD